MGRGGVRSLRIVGQEGNFQGWIQKLGLFLLLAQLASLPKFPITVASPVSMFIARELTETFLMGVFSKSPIHK